MSGMKWQSLLCRQWLRKKIKDSLTRQGMLKVHAKGGQGADSKEAAGGHPHSTPESVNWLKDLEGDRQTKNDKSPVCCCFPEGSCQQCPSTLSSS